MRLSIEMIEGLRYKLRMMGVPLTEECSVFCDNSAVVTNSRPESTLKKKHAAINFHRVREAIAAGTIRVAKENTQTNLADILTKLMPGPKMKELLHNILWINSVTDEQGEPLKDVTLTLTKPDGSTVTTVTDSNGEYTFIGLPPGTYTLTETNPPGFSDVSDYDETPDGDVGDANTVPDNKIVVTITPGEKDGGNNFVDTLDSSAPSASPVTPVPTAPLTGSVSGSVTDDDGKPIKGVALELQSPTGEVIATTTTNDLGEYVFTNIPPGDYNIVESELPLYPVDVSDYDTTPDGDVPDADTKVDNTIGVTVEPREADSGNNFVDSNKGSISGSVTDEVGEPQKNVTLTLTKPDGSTVTTVTDSNGEYTFVGLPPGDYTLTETNPPGYADVSDYDETPDGDADDSNTVPDNKIVVTITPGEKDGGNNFVNTLGSSAPSASPVTPAPTIPLTGSVSGIVTDDDGKPIKDVPLVLQTPTGEVIATTTTNDLGEYLFTNIPPGDYNVVEPVLPLYPVDVNDYDTTPDGDVPDADTKVDNTIGVTVKPQEVDTGNNFVDSDKGSITGVITDEVGEPLKNVTLTLTKPDGSTVTTVTDSNGEYTFVGLPPGNYTLTETNPPGYSDVSDYDETPDGDADDSNTVPDNKIVVTITPGEKDGGNNFVNTLDSSAPSASPVTPAPTLPLTGSVSGSVTDDDGKPIKDVPLVLQTSSGEVIATTTTNDLGEYLFTNIPPGDYNVVEPVDNIIGVTVKPQEVDTGNNFVDSDKGSITGVITDEVGEPLKNVTLTLTKPDGSTVTTVTDSNGEYTFVGLPPGTYTLTETNPPGYSDVSDYDETPDGDADDSNTVPDNKIVVTITPGEKDGGNNFVNTLDSSAPSASPVTPAPTLPLTGSVSGSVTDDDGKPIKDVPLVLQTSSGEVIATTTTNDLGEYLFTNIPPGDYNVVEPVLPLYPVDVSDYDTTPDGDVPDADTKVDNIIGVTVKPQEVDTGNNFVDSDKGSITGVITDEVGEPLKNVTLTLTKPDGSTVTTVTDSNGEYTFVGLPPGNYTLTETNPPGYSDVSDYDETPDGDADDSNTVPDNKIVVTITPGEKDGGNNFVNTLDSSAPSASPVTPAPTLPLTGSVSGSVTDDDGKPIKDVPLVLQTPSGEVIATTTTNDLGEYLFTNIPPGDYNVVEPVLPLYPVDLSDYDTTPDGDVPDADTKVDNIIGVTVKPQEVDTGNNFVDSDKGSITGVITDEVGEPLKNVTLTLTKPDGSTVTTVTDSNGEYTFVGLPPGNYTLTETNPPGYSDVSDYDETPDGDADDSNTVPDNKIVVTITPGEKDGGNNFVNTLDSSAPSASPVTPAPTLPLTGSVSGSVTDDDGKPIKDVPLVLQTPTGEVIATTTTNDLGEYLFTNIPPGDYNVVEPVLPLYPVDVSDYDATPDGDVPDADTKVDNIIGVTVKPQEVDTGNNFVDSDKGSITGVITDEVGEPLKNVTLTLTKPDGSLVTTVTDSNGEYTFVGLPPGNYTLTETNPPGYSDVSDYDETPDGDADDSNTVPDNKIVVTITPGEKDGGNNFVNTLDSSAPSASPVTPAPTLPLTGSVSGSVTDDDGKPIKDVPLVLQTSSGEVIATTTTNDLGEYLFTNIPPGDYDVVEPVLPLYPVDVSDYDATPDGDVPDSDTKVDNIIGVTVKPQEVDTGNNFVDSDKGSITGVITDEVGEPLKNVTLTLTKPDGSTVTTVTDSNGEYTFVGLPPGNYTLTETNPPGYSDVSDYDETPDGDADDSNTVPDNKIVVTITPGEKDGGNNFIDRLSIPDTSRPPTSAPIPRGPPSSPPDFCAIVPDPTCKLCAPSRSLDYCNVSESFPALIQNRTSAVRNNPSAVANEGYWFHYLEDKVAAYLLSVEQGVSAPEIFCCVTNASELSSCFLNNVPSSVDGVVIKATNFHSSQGVYVLVPNPAGNGTINLLDNTITTYAEVVAELSLMQATKIIVEEFVGTSLPTEYKFHVVNGEVVAIDIITGRGADCPCYAVVDKNWNRLDQFGCFEPGGVGSVEANGCTAIDFITGKRRAGPVKKDLYICDENSIPSDVDECLKQEMLDIALDAGARVGVYIRVDMFVAGGKVFVQEYTTNHMNGLRHCAAKFNPLTGCVDSCFIGRAWNAAGAPYGGAPTTVPSALTAFYARTPQEQCDLLVGVQPPVHVSSCPGGTVPPKPFP
ncbi:protein of unknown function DUF11 [Fragilaria crotonensis]|nr:protein of unknown function DUF11 [Fragilaria crotonensis]